MPHYSPAQGVGLILLSAAAGTWVYFHADRHRIRHPTLWAIFTFLLVIPGLVAYAVHLRRERQRRSR